MSQKLRILGTPDRFYRSYHFPFKLSLFPFIRRLIYYSLGQPLHSPVQRLQLSQGLLRGGFLYNAFVRRFDSVEWINLHRQVSRSHSRFIETRFPKRTGFPFIRRSNKKEGNMSKVVAFNGSSRRDGNNAILLNLVLDELRKDGIETELIQLSGETLSGCIVCYKCAENRDQKCAVLKDRVNEYIAKMQQSEGILLGSPTYISDMTANMKALIERSTIVSRSNGDLFKRKVGAAVITVRRAGSTHVLSSVNYFFLINQMMIPGSSYWNMGIGRNPGEVKNDAEGIQTMKTLGQNMAWLLKKISG